jgi:hypothetical protein
MDVCLLEVLLSGINICDELITGAEASYRLWCVIICDLETLRLRKVSPALGRLTGRNNAFYEVIVLSA